MRSWFCRCSRYGECGEWKVAVAVNLVVFVSARKVLRGLAPLDEPTDCGVQITHHRASSVADENLAGDRGEEDRTRSATCFRRPLCLCPCPATIWQRRQHTCSPFSTASMARLFAMRDRLVQ